MDLPMTPSVGFEQALARYQRNEFTDADVTACTGLSARSIRQLIKVRAVRTLSEDRGAGHIRKFDATTFKRLAVTSALNRAGYSLRLAGQLAYFLPGDAQLYRIYDPIAVLFDTRLSVDSRGELPPRLETPWFDWFDPDKSAAADPDNDRLLEICDGRFVALALKQRSEPLFYGDLREAGTQFVSWWAFQSHTSAVFSTDADVAPKWQDPGSPANRIDPDFLNYQYEPHDGETDRLMLEARAAAQRPVFKTAINLSLAIRLALRRYLGIEPEAIGAAT
jgi:hypothetical protein